MHTKLQLIRTEYGYPASSPFMAVSNRLRGLIGIARVEAMERYDVRKANLIYIAIHMILLIIIN